MTYAKRRQRLTVSLQLTPSPLDAAILTVLAEREAGGSRPDVGAVVTRLARAEASALLGCDVLAVAWDIAEELKIIDMDPPPEARDARDMWADGLRARLRRRVAPTSCAAPELPPEIAAADNDLRARRRASGLDPDTGSTLSPAETSATTSGGLALRVERRVTRGPT